MSQLRHFLPWVVLLHGVSAMAQTPTALTRSGTDAQGRKVVVESDIAIGLGSKADAVSGVLDGPTMRLGDRSTVVMRLGQGPALANSEQVPGYPLAGHLMYGPVNVTATANGIAGHNNAASFVLNNDPSFPQGLSPNSLGLPGWSVGQFSELTTYDSGAVYMENQDGAMATLWPATYDATHVYFAAGANAGKGAVRIGLNPAASPPFSDANYFADLPPWVTSHIELGQTTVTTFTSPQCAAHITGIAPNALTVDAWVQMGTNNVPCGNPGTLTQTAGVGIAYIQPRQAVWLTNGNLFFNNINTTARAITDELAVYNNTGHYTEHGYDAAFPSGLFPQADGPFVAGALRFSSGANPATGMGGDGYQGTVAYDAPGDWEYGFWSRTARQAHFLIAPDNPAHLGATGFLDLEPYGFAVRARPANKADTFLVDRKSGITAQTVTMTGTAAQTQRGEMQAFVAAGASIPSTSPVKLTIDGVQTATGTPLPVAGIGNVLALINAPGAARAEAKLAAYALDSSGNPQAMSATLRWLVRVSTGGPSVTISANGTPVVTLEQVDSFFSGCTFSIVADVGQQSIYPTFSCSSPLPTAVSVGGDFSVTSVIRK